jgi:dsDNA-specific endonuclease/ATPase MutS2
MSNDGEIQDIVNQLKGLQLQQAALISRLGRLSDSERQDTPPTPPQAAREFAIGDKVRIINPRILQENRGKITRIGLRITVLTPKGNSIVRAPKNLVLE